LSLQSYFVGHVNWIGYSVIAGGYGIILSQQLFACVVLANPDFVPQTYRVLLGGEGLLLLAVLFNMFGIKVRPSLLRFFLVVTDLLSSLLQIMPIVDKCALYFFFLTFFCFLIVPIVCARTLNGSLEPASFVFTTFTDAVGYGDMSGGNFVLFMVRCFLSFFSAGDADHSPLHFFPLFPLRSDCPGFRLPSAVSTPFRILQKRSHVRKPSFPEVRLFDLSSPSRKG
jgi:hypothetical protein